MDVRLVCFGSVPSTAKRLDMTLFVVGATAQAGSETLGRRHRCAFSEGLVIGRVGAASAARAGPWPSSILTTGGYVRGLRRSSGLSESTGHETVEKFQSRQVWYNN